MTITDEWVIQYNDDGEPISWMPRKEYDLRKELSDELNRRHMYFIWNGTYEGYDEWKEKQIKK